MARLYRLLPRMRGYDVVQLINPMFLELKAERILPIYKYLRRHNKKVVMGSYGMDYYWVNVNTQIRPLRYSDFNIGDKVRTDTQAHLYRQEWTDTPKQHLNQYIARDCDGIPACLYEYWATYNEVPELRGKMRFIPLPIEKASICHTTFYGGPVKVFIGISKGRSVYKGTDIMLQAAQDLKEKYPEQLDLRVAEGVPFEQYQKMMDGSDAILDQLYSYTPSMNSLLAMSKGIIVIGGGEPENYEILGEKELRPIINVQPNYQSVYDELEQLILHPERISDLKKQSVEYVRRHHDYLKVAEQYIRFYQEL